MKRYKSFFERAVEASEKVANITLQAQYQKNMFKQMLFEEGLYNRIVNDCTAKVLSRISVNSNIQKVASEIVREINNQLNNIGK